VAILIDFEGIDGSGKGTQASLLQQSLQSRGISVGMISFPQYGQTTFAKGVADFLNGSYGALSEVNPYLVSLLYAGDRFESRNKLLDLMDAHQVLILDRYVPSNMAHQGSKCDGAERKKLLEWIEAIEFGVYRLPRPNLVLWLDLPVRLAHERIAAKKPRDYTDAITDLQEADLEHLVRTRDVYQFLAQSDPYWESIPATDQDRPLEISVIAERIERAVARRFPKLR